MKPDDDRNLFYFASLLAVLFCAMLLLLHAAGCEGRRLCPLDSSQLDDAMVDEVRECIDDACFAGATEDERRGCASVCAADAIDEHCPGRDDLQGGLASLALGDVR